MIDNLTATIDGQTVSIISIDVQGSNVSVTYLAPDNSIKVKKFIYGNIDELIIATNGVMG